MTKYVSFKIFDSEDHPYGFEGIKDKQVKKYYTWVHEDYFEEIIKAHLKPKEPWDYEDATDEELKSEARLEEDDD